MAVWDYDWYKDLVKIVTAVMVGILVGGLILNDVAQYLIFAIAGLCVCAVEGIRLFVKNKGKILLKWVFSDVVDLVLQVLVLICSVWFIILAL